MSTVEPVMGTRWNAWWRLMRFDRPIGIGLLLWPTLWALWFAGGGAPQPHLVAIFVLGVVVMRAAGCVMNDIADRDLDPHVDRTRTRPLAAGQVTVRGAYTLLAVLLALAFALVLLTNRLTVLLAFAGAALALAYPFFKRFTHLPQAVLGIAFGWSVPMAFAAQAGAVPAAAWWLFAINLFYVLVYDTEYAMVDRDDDQRIGIKSTAILFGRFDRLMLAFMMAAMLGLCVVFGWRFGLAWPWYCGVAACAVLFTWQQWIIRSRDRQACFRAFLNNNWVGLALFAGLLGHFGVN